MGIVSPTPIFPKDWGLIKSDILLADTAMANKENLHMVAMAAYHYAQAIEKSLKALTKANSDKIPDHTHDIATLLVDVELCCQNFIYHHKFIADNAQELSSLNGARYGDKLLRKGDVYVLMKEAQRLHRELETDLLNSVNLSEEELQKQSNFNYKESGYFIQLDDTHSIHKNTGHKPFFASQRGGYDAEK